MNSLQANPILSCLIIFLIFALIVQAIAVLRTGSATEQIINKTDNVNKTTAPNWNSRLNKGLERSRLDIWGKLTNLLSGKQVSDEQLEQIEELLYASDLNSQTIAELQKEIKREFVGKTPENIQLKEFIFSFFEAQMKPIQDQLDPMLYGNKNKIEKKPHVIMVIGVNGAGKTTTIGKLATKFKQQGSSVLVGACDTFRAAAVDQLQVWCDRAQVSMLRAKEGADPSGVAFDALKKSTEENVDFCILDTAGRLHTNKNLMEELKKTKKVLTKIDPTAPHAVLLVIDAVTGQSAMNQAREFHQALGVTGLVFTKCDGTSKAGNAVSMVKDLGIPIAYIGVGESVEDLDVFNLQDYLKALVGIES